jgi:hypothetical protein
MPEQINQARATTTHIPIMQPSCLDSPDFHAKVTGETPSANNRALKGEPRRFLDIS